MVNPNPAPLLRGRLEKIIRGLQIRSESSASSMAEQVQTLESRIETAEQQHAEQTQTFAEQARLQRRETLTTWDQSVCSVWDEREGAAFHAIKTTQLKQTKLEKRANEELATAQAERERRIGKADEVLASEKKKPTTHLANYRKHLKTHNDTVSKLVTNAEESLQQRSLRIPQPDADTATYDAAANSKQAIQNVIETVNAAKAHCKRITNQPLASFVESAWWWAIVLLCFGGVTALASMVLSLPTLQSVIAGAVSSGLLFIGGVLCIRPLLSRVAKVEFPALLHCRTLVQRQSEHAYSVCEQEVNAAIKSLEDEHAKTIGQIESWTKTRTEEITSQRDAAITKLKAQCETTKAEMSQSLTADLANTNQTYAEQDRLEDSDWQHRIQQAAEKLEADQCKYRKEIEELQEGGAKRLRIATEKASVLVRRSEAWCEEQFPDFSKLPDSEARSWPMQSRPCVPVGKLLPSAEETVADALELAESATLLFSPLEDGYLTITGEVTHASMTELVRSVLLRLLVSLPHGRTQVCVVDPPGLGRDFGWLMHLADFDSELVTHRVWTQTAHIGKQIETLARGAEDFIQQSLRDQFTDIEAYNAEAGALAEPYRILVWSSFPEALDEPTWQSLQSILDTGARCGIIPVFLIDAHTPWLESPQAAQLMRRGMHLQFKGEPTQLTLNAGELSRPMQPAATPSENVARQLVSEVGRAALQGSRVEVPLMKMLPSREERWTADSSRELEIPIGQSGVGRTHSLTLGVGTAQHAILAGKTGSGKSSLLHALITSAMCKYSPESLRLVLLDFKKGVEFQAYSNADVPHADIIGIESHREFGLSALRYIDDCLQRRGDLFRGAGVQDIAQWNSLKPDETLPRMLLVVDEFQELFVEDDAISRDCSMILDRIVRQGRSFGVHAVLSSQTLAGAYSLPRTTLGQMAIRIALQCDPSDAQIIFTEDNPAAQRLKHPGQAVYNDAGGRIEGNQPMQIGWLSSEDRMKLLSEMEPGYRNRDETTNRLGRRVVYDGNTAAAWSSSNANLAIAAAKKDVSPDACWCIVGDSVAIEPAVAFPLTNQPGRNVLLVGGDDSMAAAVLNSVTASWVRHCSSGTDPESSQKPKLFTIQGARPTDPNCLQLPDAWQQFRCESEVVDARECTKVIQQVRDLLTERMDETEDSTEQTPVLLNILQLGRVRDLKRGDEFSFSDEGDTPDKQLEDILRDGPSVGIHTMCWAESQSTASRWLSRGSLREMEIRLAMQMSANDSTNLIESVAASKLGSSVMLLYDDATGQETPFRPAATDSLAAVTDWQATDG
ncbi:MAG: FtsK/SpoIIIE domain-containing protein [Aureliella sp.]